MAVGEPPPLSPPHEEGENPNTKPLYVTASKPNLNSITKAPKDPSRRPPGNSTQVAICDTPPPSPDGAKHKITFGSFNYSKYLDDTHGVEQPPPVTPLKVHEKLPVNTTSQASYIDALKSNSNTSLCVMEFSAIKPTSLFQGKPAVFFTIEDKKKLLSQLNHTLVGKFSHGRPSMLVIKSFFVSLKLQGNYNLSLLDNKHLVIECEQKLDFYKLWLKLSWFIQGFHMRIFKWETDFNPSKESPTAPVWVTFYGIPIYMFEKNTLLAISNVIGKPIKIAPDNVNRVNLSSARVCVELDVTKPLIDSVWVCFEDDNSKEVIDGFWVQVKYDTVPLFCNFCSHLGHDMKNCKRRSENDLADVLAVGTRHMKDTHSSPAQQTYGCISASKDEASCLRFRNHLVGQDVRKHIGADPKLQEHVSIDQIEGKHLDVQMVQVLERQEGKKHLQSDEFIEQFDGKMQNIKECGAQGTNTGADSKLEVCHFLKRVEVRKMGVESSQLTHDAADSAGVRSKDEGALSLELEVEAGAEHATGAVLAADEGVITAAVYVGAELLTTKNSFAVLNVEVPTEELTLEEGEIAEEQYVVGKEQSTRTGGENRSDHMLRQIEGEAASSTAGQKHEQSVVAWGNLAEEELIAAAEFSIEIATTEEVQKVVAEQITGNSWTDQANKEAYSPPRKLSSAAAEFTPKWAVLVEELVEDKKQSDPVLIEKEVEQHGSQQTRYGSPFLSDDMGDIICAFKCKSVPNSPSRSRKQSKSIYDSQVYSPATIALCKKYGSDTSDDFDGSWEDYG